MLNTSGAVVARGTVGDDGVELAAGNYTVHMLSVPAITHDIRIAAGVNSVVYVSQFEPVD